MQGRAARSGSSGEAAVEKVSGTMFWVAMAHVPMPVGASILDDGSTAFIVCRFFAAGFRSAHLIYVYAGRCSRQLI